MSVDQNQVPTPTPPPSLSLLDITNAVQTTANQIATQVAGQVAQDATSGLSGVVSGLQGDISGLQADFVAHKADIEAQLASAGSKVLAAATEDTWLTRVVVLLVVGAVLAGSLAVVVFAMLGNATANHWIGAAPAAIVAIVLWLSRAGGITLPTKPAAKAAA